MGREELAVYGLKMMVVGYAEELHELIGTGASKDALHTVVANLQGNLADEVTFDALGAWGRGHRCHDCGLDVTPHDPDGYPVEGWELYMVHDHVWDAAGGECHLCVGCLEARLGRRLTLQDFTDCGLNRDGSELRSERLRGRMGRTGVRGSGEAA